MEGSGYMDLSQMINAPWLYVLTMLILVTAIMQSLIFMKHAWAHGLTIGLSHEKLKKGLITGITVSIMPTLPVLVVFLTLAQLLGSPVSWLRLSVVGSAHYETYAASTALQTLGEQLVPGGFSVNGWVSAVWVMSIGGSASVLWSSLMLKPISKMYGKAEEMFDMGLVIALGSGCLTGVMAFVSVAYGLSGIRTKGVVFGISFVCGGLLVILQRKLPGMKWISDYLMAICMIVSMIFACIIF
ncbi:MAG: DUF5058 family protein [Synergistaceae bacterium]|nr:DUF5058 family protein [Synergistaceae bacterium]